MPDCDIRCCELPVLGLRFTLSTPAGGLPDFSGGVLHGALGDALKSVDADASAALFDPAQYRPRQPFPWRMVVGPPPPCRLVTEFLLFGRATRFATHLKTAMERLADKGLGKARSPLRLLRVDLRQPQGDYVQANSDLGTASAVPLSVIAQRDIPAQAERVEVRLLSSLRLKQKGRLMATAPKFEWLFQMLAERAQQLAGEADHLLDFPENWRASAAEVTLVQAETQWYEFSRYSARQRSTQRFGGLVGELVYAGQIGPFLPWLRAAEWLGIGGKTTFGLGNVSVEFG